MSELVDCIDGLTASDIIKSVAKTANGVPFYINTLGLSGFVAEYQTVYDYLTAKPDAVTAEGQSDMVAGWVENGVWALYDVLWIFAQTTNAALEAQPNWKNPGMFDCAAFNVPVFTALEGFAGNAIDMFLKPTWNPTTNGVNFIQDSASFGCYIRTNVAESKPDIGVNTVVDAYIHSRRATDSAAHTVNDVTLDTAANADSRGMFISSRIAANDKKLFRNKAVLVNDVTASTGVPNADFYILRAGTAYGSKQLSMGFAGGGATQTVVDNITDGFETYMDGIGKGVIP